MEETAQPPAIKADFRPRPDITAFELAIILPFILSEPLTEETWQNLGPITRHLIRK